MLKIKKVVIPITDELLEFLEKEAVKAGLIPEDADVVGLAYSLSSGDLKDIGLTFVIRPDVEAVI